MKIPFNPYAGGFSDFKKNHPAVPEWKWWHGQMRGWAWHWRNRRIISAMLDKPVDETASTFLSLAKNYRWDFLRTKEAA